MVAHPAQIGFRARECDAERLLVEREQHLAFLGALALLHRGHDARDVGGVVILLACT